MERHRSEEAESAFFEDVQCVRAEFDQGSSSSDLLRQGVSGEFPFSPVFDPRFPSRLMLDDLTDLGFRLG